MEKYFYYFFFFLITPFFDKIYSQEITEDTIQIYSDTIKYEPSFFSTYELKDRYSDPFSSFSSSNPFNINSSMLKLSSSYDTSNVFNVDEKLGSIRYRPSISIPFSSYDRYNTNKQVREYFQNKSLGLDLSLIHIWRCRRRG